MTKTAIISEFNPFHNGHRRIIEKAIEETHGDIISLMSGNFVQRGEPAIQNKFVRAVQSINNGVSMSLELPIYFSLSNAETFASGAISILNKYGVNYLYFGSENGDVEVLSKIAENELKEPKEMKESISFYLNKGQLFAKAKENAAREFYGEEYANIIKTPNNILSIEYIKAIITQKSSIIPLTSKREVNDKIYSSSSKIRQSIFNNDYNSIGKFIPEKIDSNSLLLNNSYEPIIYTLLCNELSKISKEELSKISEVSEGLENRFIKYISLSKDYQSLISNIKTKRYTMSKIKRILLSIILKINNDLSIKAIKELQNIKVIAISNNKLSLLDTNNISLIKGNKDFIDDEFARADNRADNLYKILKKEQINSHLNHKMIIV